MSIKRTYKVDDIYFLSTKGFIFSMEKDFQLYAYFTERKMNLSANGKHLAVKLKGIEQIYKKQQPNLLLTSLNEDKSELMRFLEMSDKKIHLQNVKDVCLEVEFFDEQEIQKILAYEQKKV